MKEVKKRITELQNEANNLLTKRQNSVQMTNNINVRLAQIDGALKELQDLNKQSSLTKKSKDKD